jgi:cyclophilin family peptidyl-prolyl cis-trans isomerase
VEARLGGNTNVVTPNVRIDDVVRFEPPQITIRSPGQGTQLTTAQAQLSAVVEDQKQPIKEIKILVNGRLVGNDELSKITGTRGISVRIERIEVPANQRRVEFSLPITLEPGNNRIQIIASNNYSESTPATVEIFYQTSRSLDLPNLWILSIGINRYDAQQLTNLSYAVNDAREIINVFKAQEGKLYRTVNSLLIADNADKRPTRENIIDGFEFLKDRSSQDTLVLFIAAHGMNDNTGDFFVMPSDAGFTDEGAIRASRAIPYSDIQRLMRLPGRKLIFIDTCHSGGLRGRGYDDNRMIRALNDIEGTIIFAASKNDESSQELSNLQHGVFTYYIIQGMKGAADPSKTGTVNMMELCAYVSRMVKQSTNQQQNPRFNAPDGFSDFPVAALK